MSHTRTSFVQSVIAATEPAAIALERGGAIWPDMPLREAEVAWVEARIRVGASPSKDGTILTPPEAQAKIGLNAALTWSMAVLAGTSHGFCVNSKFCFDICVVQHAGRAKFWTTQLARIARAELLRSNPQAFARILLRDLEGLERRGVLNGRPNANSDVAWEKVFPWLFTRDGYRYDYTKRIDRVGYLSPDYRVIYSATGLTRESTIRRLTGRGDNVAMIFPLGKKDPKPSHWRGIPVLDGDLHDDRFIEPGGHIVALRWKGSLIGQPEHPMVSPLA